jgi:hypothetical protein
MFISRDSYHADNHYAFGNANPVTFSDPTGHSARQATNYTVGAVISALGILGFIASIPTGGLSLTLSSVAGIAAGITTSFSGLSLLGSQALFDSEYQTSAKTLSYTSLGLGILSIIEAGVSLAPWISARFFATPSTVNLSDIPSTISNTDSAALPSLENSAEVSIASSFPSRSEDSIFSRYGSVDNSLGSSNGSQVSIRLGTGAEANATARYIASSRQTVQSPSTTSLYSFNVETIEDNASSASRFLVPDTAISSAPSTTETSLSALNPEPASQLLRSPATPGSFATPESIFSGMNGSNTVLEQNIFDDLLGTDNLQGLDRSTLEEIIPDEGFHTTSV